MVTKTVSVDNRDLKRSSPPQEKAAMSSHSSGSLIYDTLQVNEQSQQCINVYFSTMRTIEKHIFLFNGVVQHFPFQEST